MQWLADLAQTILKTPGRIGLVLAIAAGALVYLRSAGIETVMSIPAEYVHYSILAGLVGATAATLSFGGQLLQWIRGKLRSNRERYERGIAGINNLSNGYREYQDVMAYLYANDIRRFAGRRDNSLLSKMAIACILEIDDPPGSFYSNDTFFVVPSHIWEFLDKHSEQLRRRPVPESAPWKEFDSWIL